MPFQFKINLDLQLKDLLGDADVIVPRSVIDELYGLDKGGNKYAKMALQLSKKYRMVNHPGSGDTAIVELAKKNKGSVVVTSDKGLQRRLGKLGIKRIRLFKKRYLGWDQQDL